MRQKEIQETTRATNTRTVEFIKSLGFSPAILALCMQHLDRSRSVAAQQKKIFHFAFYKNRQLKLMVSLDLLSAKIQLSIQWVNLPANPWSPFLVTDPSYELT